VDSFSNSISATTNGFRAIVDEDNWMIGIYFLGDYLRTAAIHQLPRTEETLWLRTRDSSKQAISEIVALNESSTCQCTVVTDQFAGFFTNE